MERQSVDSTTVRGIGYATEAQTLEVEFTSGRVYQYFDVPPEIYRAFAGASSKGSYFNAEIKNVYRFSEVKSK